MVGRFRALLEHGSVIVFDGGLGTTLFNRGVFINRCFDQLNLDQPELVADRVQGIQIDAPFGRYQAAISMLEVARRLVPEPRSTNPFPAGEGASGG